MTTPRIHVYSKHCKAGMWLPPRDANTLRMGAEAKYDGELASRISPGTTCQSSGFVHFNASPPNAVSLSNRLCNV
jgi:hypothetical protein